MINEMANNEAWQKTENQWRPINGGSKRNENIENVKRKEAKMKADENQRQK